MSPVKDARIVSHDPSTLFTFSHNIRGLRGIDVFSQALSGPGLARREKNLADPYAGLHVTADAELERSLKGRQSYVVATDRPFGPGNFPELHCILYLPLSRKTR